MAMTQPTHAQPDYPWSEQTQTALEVTKPLGFPRQGRLPLFTNPASDPGLLDDATALELVSQLDTRGMAAVCSWNPGDREGSMARALPVARAQQQLGLSVNVNATSCMYSFFDGDAGTAHVDAQGRPFFDESLWRKEMGCAYTLDARRPVIKERIEHFVQAYADAGLEVGFSWADWEIDGPLEINRAHEYARRCVRCREHLPEIDDYRSFQKAMREMRSYLQFDTYAQPMLERFPNALVGNYAVYPHDGYRYWLDFFESADFPSEQPHIVDQNARYRAWYQDFTGTGYTYAMPVVYAWHWIYQAYDFANTDYRWFRNMLLVGTNAGRSTPAQIPVVAFIHKNPIAVPEGQEMSVEPMSAWSYQELLWHMLLRGVDTFFVWCGGEESAEEVGLAHEVYAAAQEYGDFLDSGMPTCFDVPAAPGTVISALVLGDRALVRRTDFGDDAAPVEILVGSRLVSIAAAPGACQVVDLGPQ
jgi:hypothetical protein